MTDIPHNLNTTTSNNEFTTDINATTNYESTTEHVSKINDNITANTTSQYPILPSSATVPSSNNNNPNIAHENTLWYVRKREEERKKNEREGKANSSKRAINFVCETMDLQNSTVDDNTACEIAEKVKRSPPLFPLSAPLSPLPSTFSLPLFSPAPLSFPPFLPLFLTHIQMKTNTTVRNLVVKSHMIGDRGTLAIAAMLKVNATLESLSLTSDLYVGRG
jgi:hypothetical protein